MRFRELYQTDLKAVEPRPELLAATRALYARHARSKPWANVRASTLGVAACLLLAMGLCLGLPGDVGNDAGNVAPTDRSVTEDAREARQDIQTAAYADARSGDTSPATAAEGARSRTAAPLADTAGTMNKLCSYPLLETEYAADCVNRGDSAIRPTFALKLLQPARNHEVYLIRCGLWLTEYNISTTIY